MYPSIFILFKKVNTSFFLTRKQTNKKLRTKKVIPVLIIENYMKRLLKERNELQRTSFQNPTTPRDMFQATKGTVVRTSLEAGAMSRSFFNTLSCIMYHVAVSKRYRNSSFKENDIFCAVVKLIYYAQKKHGRHAEP